MTSKKKISCFIVFCCLLTVPAFLFSPSSAQSSGEITLTGTLPLVIYNIAVTDVDTSDSTFTWQTNGYANSTVEYGTTSSYGFVSSDVTVVTGHVITLNGLSPNTIYHYQLVSTTPDGQSCASNDSTFQTLPLPVPTQNGGGNNGGRSNEYSGYVGVAEAPAPLQNPGPMLAPPMSIEENQTPVPRGQPGAASGAPHLQPVVGVNTSGIVGLIISNYIILIFVIACLFIGGILVYADRHKQMHAQKKPK